jgi:hypothetical protein
MCSNQGRIPLLFFLFTCGTGIVLLVSALLLAIAMKPGEWGFQFYLLLLSSILMYAYAIYGVVRIIMCLAGDLGRRGRYGVALYALGSAVAIAAHQAVVFVTDYL